MGFVPLSIKEDRLPLRRKVNLTQEVERTGSWWSCAPLEISWCREILYSIASSLATAQSYDGFQLGGGSGVPHLPLPLPEALHAELWPQFLPDLPAQSRPRWARKGDLPCVPQPLLGAGAEAQQSPGQLGHEGPPLARG